MASAAAASRWRAVFGGTRTLMAAAKEPSASSSSASAKGASTKKFTSARGSGIQKVVPISPQLGRFLGASYSSRTQAIKLIWEYIKLHQLQVISLPFFSVLGLGFCICSSLLFDGL
jgi:chromatin remodeling complex protein RSC6